MIYNKKYTNKENNFTFVAIQPIVYLVLGLVYTNKKKS